MNLNLFIKCIYVKCICYRIYRLTPNTNIQGRPKEIFGEKCPLKYLMQKKNGHQIFL